MRPKNCIIELIRGAMKTLNNEKHTCENCIWKDQCPDLLSCEDFTPIYDDINERIEYEICEGRKEFHREWNIYLKSNNFF